MQKLHIFLLSLVGFITSSSAQIPTEKTLLWQVTGKGIIKPSYLFGTIHLMCPGELIMPDVVKEKFAATQKLFLEINLDDPDMMTKMMAGMQMKGPSTLEELTGTNFKSADSTFKAATGMSLKMLNTTKPLLIMSMIYPSLLGCTPVSWESEFQKMAKDKKIEINGLEKVEDQLDVFEKIPYKVQSNMLVKMLSNMDSTKSDFQQMLDVYNKKDISKLNVLTEKEEDFGPYRDILLDNRNEKWIPLISEQVKIMPTFFAFGAGHLGGETGVINLLRKAGFSVKPVFYQ